MGVSHFNFSQQIILSFFIPFAASFLIRYHRRRRLVIKGKGMKEKGGGGGGLMY